MMERPIDKTLPEALAVVATQTTLMRRCLDTEQLMDGLKAASTLLSELRTSSLTPKEYYQLYMAIFDSLGRLSTYLYDAHTQNKQHLADIYELVQYSGACVPRLYLMVTVGSIYMKVADAPIREIMQDLMEMSKSVQHPVRGLFLRHYLSGQTRDFLPSGNEDLPSGNLQDSIAFILTNLMEMSKLWIRLQHQGHSREREKREIERKELRILVGTNLVRLSSLDGLELATYKSSVLPSILKQIISCRDVIAQDYLMEVLIQVFSEEFHLSTLRSILSATAQLLPRANIKQIVITLIDRLAVYAVNDTKAHMSKQVMKDLPPSPQSSPPAHEKDMPAMTKSSQIDVTQPTESEHRGETSADHPTSVTAASNPDRLPTADSNDQANDTPSDHPALNDIALFDLFWRQVVQLVHAREDMQIQDISALLVSMLNLSLSCYPFRTDYVDQVLEYAATKLSEPFPKTDLQSPITQANVLALLLAPIRTYDSPLTLFKLTTYTRLLDAQNLATRRSVAHAVVSSMLRNETKVSTLSDVRGVLSLCHVITAEVVDNRRNGTKRMDENRQNSYDLEEMEEEQGWIARIIHLFASNDNQTQLELLQTARRAFQDSGDKIQFTFPTLSVAAINLANKLRYSQESTRKDPTYQTLVQNVFRFVYQVTTFLYNRAEASNICIRLFLLAAQAGDTMAIEEQCYEFYVQALTIYEESVSDSHAQIISLTAITRALFTSRGFSRDNYETLVVKLTAHANRLLRKNDQAQALLCLSHIWWQTPVNSGLENHNLVRRGDRVLGCLQKSLRIASATVDEVTSLQIYIDTIEKFLYFFQEAVFEITADHLNSLLKLVYSNQAILSNSDNIPSPSTRVSGGLFGDVENVKAVLQHATRVLQYAQQLKLSNSSQPAWSSVLIPNMSCVNG